MAGVIRQHRRSATREVVMSTTREAYRFWVWGFAAMAMAGLEWPFLKLVVRLLGPVLQPWPHVLPRSMEPVKTDVFASLAIPFGALLYVLIWIVFLGASSVLLRPEWLRKVWWPAWAMFLGVVVLEVLHTTKPWLAVIADQTGVARPSSMTWMGFLDLRPRVGVWFQVPGVVLLTLAWSSWRCFGRGWAAVERIRLLSWVWTLSGCFCFGLAARRVLLASALVGGLGGEGLSTILVGGFGVLAVVSGVSQLRRQRLGRYLLGISATLLALYCLSFLLLAGVICHGARQYPAKRTWKVR